MELGDSMEFEALNENPIIERPRIRAEALYDPASQTRIRAEDAHDLPVARGPRTDLGKTSGKNPSDGLIRPVQELAKLVTETSIKVRKPKTYDEAANNPINGNRWQKAIDKKLWNLNSPVINRKADVPGLQNKARHRFYCSAVQLPQLGHLSRTPPHCQAGVEVSEGYNHSGYCLGK